MTSIENETMNGDSKIEITKAEKNKIRTKRRKESLRVRKQQRLEAGLTGPIPKHPLGPLVSFFCDVCNLKLDSQTVYDAHLGGVKHQRKLKKPLRCDLCNIILPTEEVLEAHEKGTKHQKRLKAESNPPVHCDVCNLDVKNDAVYQIHLAGQKHLRRAALLPCEICDLKFSNEEELKRHTEGPKHVKKVKMLEYISFLQGADSGFTHDVASNSYMCVPCRKSFPSDNVLVIPGHLGSKGHIDKCEKIAKRGMELIPGAESMEVQDNTASPKKKNQRKQKKAKVVIIA